MRRLMPIVDGHCDSILAQVTGERDLARGDMGGDLDLPRLREAGVAVQFMASFIETEYKPAKAVIRGLECVEACRRLIRENPEQLELVENYADIERAMQAGHTGALLSVEGGEALGGELFMLSVLYSLGVRSICLTWNQANQIAGGVGEPGKLTSFGSKVITEMNRLGMLIDVSHLSEESFWGVLQKSSMPVIASHSCCRSLCEHPRNLTNLQIKALASAGGVVGINFYAQFLKGDTASLEDVIRHIEHICSLVGPEHVGLGSDFDGGIIPPLGLENVAKLPDLAKALMARGYQREIVAMIMGGNFLRVIRQVIG